MSRPGAKLAAALVAALALARAAGAAEPDELPRVAPSRGEERGPREEHGALRARAVDAARRRLGTRFGGDCSGFVISAWRDAGVVPPLGRGRSRSESLARASRTVERPRPGDLAFFDQTYDRNHDGRANDRYTHVALVEEVDGERVTLLHRGVSGVERIHMDLAAPSDPERNDILRRLRGRDPRGTRVLAGELFAGFGAVAGADPDVSRAAARKGPASPPPRASPARASPRAPRPEPREARPETRAAGRRPPRAARTR